MKMKSLLPVSMVVAATFAAMGGAFSAQAAEEKVLKITAIVEHPALDAVREGVLDELQEGGYIQGQNLDVEFQSAQGDVGIANQIAQKFAGDKPDAIVAIATPSAQAAVSAAKGNIPVVFSAVTDPVAAKLIDNPERPGANVTGVTDMTPVDAHLKLIKTVVPNAKTVGIVHNPGEANAVVLVELAKKFAPAHQLDIIVASAPDTGSVLQATRSLVGKVDAIYVPTDNTVVSALESLIKVAEDADIPVVAADTDSVKRGAAVAAGFNYYDIGRQTGKIVINIFEGTNPGDISMQGVEKTELFVNPAAAERMGFAIPEDMVKNAKEVIE